MTMSAVRSSKQSIINNVTNTKQSNNNNNATLQSPKNNNKSNNNTIMSSKLSNNLTSNTVTSLSNAKTTRNNNPLQNQSKNDDTNNASVNVDPIADNLHKLFLQAKSDNNITFLQQQIAELFDKHKAIDVQINEQTSVRDILNNQSKQNINNLINEYNTIKLQNELKYNTNNNNNNKTNDEIIDEQLANSNALVEQLTNQYNTLQSEIQGIEQYVKDRDKYLEELQTKKSKLKELINNNNIAIEQQKALYAQEQTELTQSMNDYMIEKQKLYEEQTINQLNSTTKNAQLMNEKLRNEILWQNNQVEWYNKQIDILNNKNIQYKQYKHDIDRNYELLLKQLNECSQAIKQLQHHKTSFNNAVT